MGVDYDVLAPAYAAARATDARIAARIRAALGDAVTVVNVGAGTGSYEPEDRTVVAVEPSVEMLRARPAGAAPAVRAVAEALPFADAAFDAALAIFTVHHWSDQTAGIAELRRVARRRIVLTSDTDVFARFWVIAEYFPDVIPMDRARFPRIEDLSRALGGARVEAVPVARDCADGFAGAHWARPEVFLDPVARGAMSIFAALPATVVDAGVARLRADLASGAWQQRHADLRDATTLDVGIRLLIAG